MLNRTLLLSVFAAAVFALSLFSRSSSAFASEIPSRAKVATFHADNALFLGQNDTRRPSLGDKFKQMLNRILPDDNVGNNHNRPSPVVPPAVPMQPPKPITAAEIQQSQTPVASSQGQRSPSGVASTAQPRSQANGMTSSITRESDESEEESTYQKLARLRQPVFTVPLEEAAKQSRQSSNSVRTLSPSPTYENVLSYSDTVMSSPRETEILAPSVMQSLPSVLAGSAESTPREMETPQPMPQMVPNDTVTPSQEAARRIAALDPEPPYEPEKQRIVSVSPVLEVEIIKPPSAVINQEVTYRVRVTNTGNAPAERVTLTVGIPSWIEVRNIDCSNGNVIDIPREDGSSASDLEWKINRINQGGSELLVLRLVSRVHRNIELPIDHTFDRPTIIAKVEVQEPKLEMELLGADEVLWNETVVYTLLVRNVGNGDAENLKFDLQQTNTAEGKTCAPPEPLRPGDGLAIDVEVRAGREQEYIDLAISATGSHDLKGDVKRRIRVLRPRLNITVQTQPLHLVDSAAEIFIRVQNVGTADAEKINIRAELPLGANYEASSEGGILAHQQQQNVVEWRGRTIERGEMQTFTLVCSPRREGDCRVSVEANDPGGSLLADGNATFVAEAVTEMELVVLKPSGAVELGQEAEYTIQITNSGTKAVENAEVSMAFGWKVGQKEQVAVLEPIEVGGAGAVLDNGMVVFDKIPMILPKQTVTLQVIAKAVETGNVQIKTEVTGTEINLTNGISTYVFSRTATASGKTKQDEVFR